MTDRLDTAARAFRRAEAAAEQRRAELVEAIVEAADGGMPQVEIVKVTGYTREHIRRITSRAARTQDLQPTRLS